MHANLISLCRICLENGATLPIFQAQKQSSVSSILSKMSQCFGGEIEDVDGYPKKICETCNKTLDKTCDFINQYKESCIVLEKNIEIIIKRQPIETYKFQDPCDIFQGKENTGSISPCEILAGKREITVEILKEETLEDIDFSDHSNDDTDKFTLKTDSNKDGNNEQQIKIVELTKNHIKIIKKCEDVIPNVKKKTCRSKNDSNRTSRIASSLLEGEFTWTGEQWSLVTPVLTRQQNVKGETSQANRLLSHDLKNRNLNEKKNKNVCLTRHKKIKTQLQEKNGKKVRKQRRKNTNLCDHCGKVFCSKNSLKNHLQLLNISPQQYKCTMCPRTFKTQLYLDHHCGRVHNQIEKKFMCSACGHAFAYLKDLNTHYKNVHNEEYKKRRNNRLFYCKICGKSFRNGVAVIIHTRSVHTGERPAVCTVCDAKFFHEDYLKQHMRLHTGETPYKCPICYRGYAQRCNMLSHVKHNHRKSQYDEILLKSLKPFVLKAMQP